LERLAIRKTINVLVPKYRVMPPQKRFETIEVQSVRYSVVKESEIKSHLFAILLLEWGEAEFNKEYPEMDRWGWTVETLKVSSIRLWKPLMEDAAFISDLGRRVEV